MNTKLSSEDILEMEPSILGGLGRIRTYDLRFRKPTFYPTELRDHKISFKFLEFDY